MSFNNLLTGSPTSSTDSSSDLDTESTGSFFHDRSITLGSLIGTSSIVELSRRRSVGAAADRSQPEPLKPKKPCSNKSKTWMIFSLCSKEDSTDVKDSFNCISSSSNNNNNNPPSLGHFLAVERQAAGNNNDRDRNHATDHVYLPGDEMSFAQHLDNSNSLFVDGRIAPPRASPWSGSGVEGGHSNGSLDHGNGCGIPLLFSCMCSGQEAH